MPAKKPARPRAQPTKVRLGAARVNRSDLDGLRRAWQAKELVLCLGAGVSMPYGFPSWNDLLLELVFEQAQHAGRLKPLAPEYRRAVAGWMTEAFDADPLVLARRIEHDLGRRARRGAGDPTQAFLERLRTHLYANERRLKGPTALTAVTDLVARSTRTRGVAAVITFNFDDLLERGLRRRRVPFVPVSDARRPVGPGLRIYHAHGYVPSTGPLARGDVVFTEDDYHRLTETAFHWSLSEIVERLRKSTVLFVGLSMSDPNLRRLLDASKNDARPRHWQIQKRHAIRPDQRAAVRAQITTRATAAARILGLPAPAPLANDSLDAAIARAVRQADTYDDRVFQSMGVKTIWIDDFAEIPDVLAGIGGKRRSGAR